MPSEFIVSLAKEDTPNYDIFSYLAHTDPLFKSLTILPIDKIFIDSIGISMFKVTYELISKSIHHYFSKTKTSTRMAPEIKIY